MSGRKAGTAWEGCEGSIGYLAKMFPRLSETFILEEILALERAGVPVRIYSLLPPTRDSRAHPQAAARIGVTDVLPQPSWRTLPDTLRNLGACFRKHPGTTARQVLRLLLWPTPRHYRRLSSAAALAVRLERDRVVHIHAAWAHTPASVARIASRLSGIPWSFGAHAKDVYLSRPASLAKKLSDARFALACSRATRDLLAALPRPRRRADGPEPEVTLIQHGVDGSFFSPGEDPPGDPPIVLSVARLVPKKGFDVLLRAMSRLRGSLVGFRLVIIGDGPERIRLEGLAHDLGIADRVRFRGSRVHAEVRDAMRRATCFVLASRVTPDGDRDGIPNTVVEAMAVGLPVVATRLPGLEELVEDGRTGLLVEPEDDEALARAIEAVIADPERAKRLGHAARESVLRRFDAEALGAARAARFARALGAERVLVLCADRGVPVQGHKGASVHLRSMVGALRSLGLRVMVLAARRGPEDGPDPGVPVTEIRARGAAERLAATLARLLSAGKPLERALLRLLDVPVLHREGLEAARAFRPDLIYERYALGAMAGSLLARRLHVPHVLEVNAPLADEEARFRGLALSWLQRAIERWLFRRADRLVVVSEALARHARALGVHPDRIAVLANGVDEHRFHPGLEGAPVRDRLGLNGAVVAGFCGTLKPWHGVERLLAAVARISGALPELEVLVIGEGPERERLAALARTLGLEGRVRFVGAVPHDRVGEHLAACDLLVAPYEAVPGFYFSPLKLAEYRAVGRPVVVSAVGPLARLGEAHGVVSVPPGDEAALGAALLDLARDSARRRQLGRAACSAPPWTWNDVARAVMGDVERARRESWGWERPRALHVGYVLKMFPRLSETFVLREILELERRGAQVTVFAMKTSDEELRQPGLGRLRARVLAIPPARGRGSCSIWAAMSRRRCARREATSRRCASR